MTIAYDHTKVNAKPVRWDMKGVFVLASWLGIAGVIGNFILFYIMMVYLKIHPDGIVFLPNIPAWINIDDKASYLGFIQTLFFINLTVAGHFTIFNTRTSNWFFMSPFPSWQLLLASFVTAAAGTVVGVYGFDLMTKVDWQWVAFIWGYAFVWFIFNDMIKVGIIKFYKK